MHRYALSSTADHLTSPCYFVDGYFLIEIENAIEIAWNPTADQRLKSQAFDFLNQLRAEPTAWQVCITLFSRAPRASDIVRHTALEVVNHAIQSQQLDIQSLTGTKDALLAYIRQVYGGLDGVTDIDPPSIRNKLTQTTTYLFESLYAKGWEDFFDDFYSLAKFGQGPADRYNASGLVFYLRVLNSIHDEIADVLVLRTPEEVKRNNELKDLIRQRDAQKVALFWQEVLSQWRAAGDEIIELCLRVISRWASWIDISLVANEGLLQPLFQLVAGSEKVRSETSQENIRIAASDTITEFVAKKMKSSDKIELIIFLNVESVVAQLMSTHSLKHTRSAASEDNDMAEAVARLINMTACEVVRALDVDVADEKTKEQANSLLQLFIPWVLRFFSDEYDEVCSTVIPALVDLLALFRRDSKLNGNLSPQYASMLSPILNAIVLKMRYDETSSWGREDEQTDEAEFQELRKRLQVLQQAVAAVDENLYIEVISTVVMNTFEQVRQQGGRVDWRDLDLALHEMFLFGEFAVQSGGLYSKGQPTSPGAETLTIMMTKMLQSGTLVTAPYRGSSNNVYLEISGFQHPAIQLQYMEICVRYYSFFQKFPNLAPQVLEQFVRLVHHGHVRVRTRSWYLFQRFVKQLRPQLGNVSQTVVQAVGDLLNIKAELPRHDLGEDGLSSNEGDQSSDSIFNSQLFLFEAIGCISSSSTVPIENQALFAQSVVEPLFSDLSKHLPLAKDGDERAVLQVHHAIMAIGTLARGFSDGTPGGPSSPSATPAEAVAEVFMNSTEAILVALESLKSSFSVRTAARFAFSRLIALLGARILPQLPRWIEGLLSESSSKDEMTTFLRLLEQIVYGFKSDMYSILDALLTPLLQRVFAELTEPTTGTDDEIQLTELRREYLNLLLAIFNNELASVLVSNGNGLTDLILRGTGS